MIFIFQCLVSIKKKFKSKSTVKVKVNQIKKHLGEFIRKEKR
jgi:hypothetical protein